MLESRHILEHSQEKLFISKNHLGSEIFRLLHHHNIGAFVKKRNRISNYNRSFWEFEHIVKAPNDGYIIKTLTTRLYLSRRRYFHISKPLWMESKSAAPKYKTLSPFLKGFWKWVWLLPIVSFNYLFGKDLLPCIPSMSRTKVDTRVAFTFIIWKKTKKFDLKSNFETLEMIHFY
jgi:hypothetical protein